MGSNPPYLGVGGLMRAPSPVALNGIRLRTRWPTTTLFMFILVCLLTLWLLVWQTQSTPSPLSSTVTSRFLPAVGVDTTELNYGIIIDAGSTGSRLFLYCWPRHSGSVHDLIRITPVVDSVTQQPVVKKINPGLSDFAETPQNASVYMRPLLDLAETHVPVDKRESTPLFIMATAGMRLVEDSKRDAILTNLRKELPKMYKFQIMDSYIEVISGKWEGIYSWIAVNYILGTLGHSEEHEIGGVRVTEGPRTVGMLDMGGASLQIAFEYDGSLPHEAHDLTHAINLGCKEHETEHQYQLYVTTFLGYGANQAEEKYEQGLATLNGLESKCQTKNNGTLDPVIRDVCMPVNLIKRVHDELVTCAPTETPLSYTRKGIGAFTKCLSEMTPLLDKEKKQCAGDYCSLNGVPQPPVKALAGMQFYGFSEFWYSLQDVLHLGGTYDYRLIMDAAQRYCNDTWSQIQKRDREHAFPTADSSRLRTQCFKGAWVMTVLHSGFGFPKDYRGFRSAQTLKGQEVQWALGALLYKMRYFPLHEIQRVELEAKRRHDQEHHQDFTFKPPPLSGLIGRLVLVGCLFAVVAVAVRYFLIIRASSRKTSTASFRNGRLPRNRSMWSYMGDDGSSDRDRLLLEGVRIEHSDYVY